MLKSNIATAYANTKAFIRENHAYVDQVFNEFFPSLNSQNNDELIEKIEFLKRDVCGICATGHTNFANIDFVEKSMINEPEITQEAFKNVMEGLDWFPDVETYGTLEKVLEGAKKRNQEALCYLHHIKTVIVRDYQDLIISKFNHELQA